MRARIFDCFVNINCGGTGRVEGNLAFGRYNRKLWIARSRKVAYPQGDNPKIAAMEAAQRIRHDQAYHR